MRRTRRCEPFKQDVVVIGVDVAKHRHVAVPLGAEDVHGKTLTFEVSSEGFEAFLAYAREFVARSKAMGFVVALESTGHYGATLVEWLLARKIQVFSVQPSHTNRAKTLYDGTTRKTDAKDALVIASLCRQGLCRPFRVPEGVYAHLRVLEQQREQLVKRRNQTLNRLHRHIDVVFPELLGQFKKIESKTCMWVLEHMPTPKDVLALSIPDLSRILRAVSRGQLGQKRAEALHAAAQRSVGIQEAIDSHRLAISQLVGEMECVQAQMQVIEQKMSEALKQVPYAELLRTIPRIGTVTIATLLGEFGDLRGFKHSRQLIAMAGLDLVENSSGERQGHHHISRRGRAYARQILYLAALRVGSGIMAEPRRRQVEDRKKSPVKAAVANMARLLRLMHAIVRDGRPYNPNHCMEMPARKAA